MWKKPSMNILSFRLLATFCRSTTYPNIYQTRCSRGCFTNTFIINYLSGCLFTPNLQQIINPKPIELGSWNFEIMFTSNCVSEVRCQVSDVTCCVMSYIFNLNNFIWFCKRNPWIVYQESLNWALDTHVTPTLTKHSKTLARIGNQVWKGQSKITQ